MTTSRDYIGETEHACLRAGLILRPVHLSNTRLLALDDVRAFVAALPSTPETRAVLEHIAGLKAQQ